MKGFVYQMKRVPKSTCILFKVFSKNIRVASIQNEYSLLCRLYDLDMAELSHHENISLLAYSPLAGGFLTGKYLNENIPKNSRLSRVPSLFGRINDNSTKAVKEYIKVSKNFKPSSYVIGFL